MFKEMARADHKKINCLLFIKHSLNELHCFWFCSNWFWFTKGRFSLIKQASHMEPVRGHEKPQAPVLQKAAQHDESSHSGATEIRRLLYLFFPTAYRTADYFLFGSFCYALLFRWQLNSSAGLHLHPFLFTPSVAVVYSCFFFFLFPTLLIFLLKPIVCNLKIN